MNSEIDYAAEYDNSGRVENSSQLINKYITDAANFRELAASPAQMNLAYGNNERNLMDIFWPNNTAGQERKSPIVMFIHGGYWQRMDRSCFSHLAMGLNAHGVAVAMPSYTLCPDISIDGIINEMRRACLVLFQTYRKKLTVIGHSAGGHLAACMMATDWTRIHPVLPHDMVASGLGLSGLYDLLPLTQTPVNDAVGMDEAEAVSASPIFWTPVAIQQFDAWVGEDESSEYHRQGRDLSARWNLLGTPTRYVSVPAANHFTIVDELVNPASQMVRRILNLVQKPQAHIELPELDNDEVDALVSRFVEESQSDPEPVSDTADQDVPVWPPHTANEEDTHENGLALPPEARGGVKVEPLSEHDPEQTAERDQKNATAQEKAE
ncbi:MAG: alpha/beta hydrolase [Hyphomicrobiales bacterium]|nr:alpha/beta hydrolase [Hyphomicrobiales bacterium]